MTIVPTLCQVVNLSLSTGCFPSVLSKAIVTPILKKPTLDCQQLKNYRPVSNLPFLGKLIERAVSSQVATYVGSNSLGEPLQSAYRCVHSTETALLAVQDSFLRAIDDRKAVFLVMIDIPLRLTPWITVYFCSACPMTLAFVVLFIVGSSHT